MNVQDLIIFALKIKEDIGYGGTLNTDEGVLFGDANTNIRGLLLTWMADVEALQAATELDCNVVLCHEQFYFTTMLKPMRPQEMSWPANYARMQAAAKGGLTVLRVHGSLDLICIYDDFIAALGIDNSTPGTAIRKVLPIASTTGRRLIEQIKERFDLEHVRVCGDLDKTVSVAGFPWGGLALDSNVGFLAECVRLGAEVLIAGECDEYGFSFARDAGVPMIETGHALSENIGIKAFANRLKSEFPDIPIHFHSGNGMFSWA